ncbi:MAG: hypothetical protein COA78_11385 [Blastopirellula sp.]|nr:MAG: hypothetical protein COA78_11385 [Blastopirellula sp.]
MNTSQRIAFSLCVSLFLCGFAAGADAKKADWGIQIVPPKSESVYGSTIRLREPFHVVLTNTSGKKLNVWREWCSWGYYNLTFEIQLKDGKKYEITKRPATWTRNGPDAYFVKKGAHFVYTIRFADDIWQGIPDNVQSHIVKIKALYKIEKDDETKEFNVWTGNVESEVIEVHLY